MKNPFKFPFSLCFSRRLLPLLVVPLVSCTLLAPDDKRNRTALEHAWQLWQESRPDDYSYIQQNLCYCGTEAVAAVRITVRNDIVVARRYYPDDAPVPLYLANSWGTIDELFHLIEEALESGAHSVHVTYHRTQGYPTHISIDYRVMVADDEIAITAGSLQALEPSRIQ